ncbi:hypothetical protein [Hymenobacter psoromatis]|uniref:hypothetical protein n=1 Tax=Hymenobacter psoromatis TaxID=1484116 RepID=UPI001CC10B31|nr:hypothetical protein [Hymenobacter psoromatis]
MATTATLPATAARPARRAAGQGAVPPEANRDLKWGIWAYIILIILEGALRRWVLPSLATPLLIVRDPIALWLMVAAWRRGLLPANPYLAGTLFIGILGIISALLVGHGNLAVALYGARILLLHFPLIFVIGRIFNRADVLRVGQAFVWMTPAMALLIAVQFYSPQSAFVNRGVGGDLAGAGFDGAMGFFRPPGTFSFTNGTHMFFGLAACFVCYFWLDLKRINRLVLTAATVGLLSAIPFSISRSLLLYVTTAGLFTVIGLLRKPKNLGRVLLLGLGGCVLLLALSRVSILQTPIEAFVSRFTDASDVEGGLRGSLGNRYLGGMLEALINSSQQPFFGYGIGMGTNAGSAILTGERSFIISEGEWGRLIGELGPLLGIGIIFIRMALSVKLTAACYQRLLRDDLLPWILLGNALLMIPQAQWAQPTALGFSTLIAGLVIAVLRPASTASSFHSVAT